MKITRNQLFSIIKEEIENQVTDVTTDVDTDAEVPDSQQQPMLERWSKLAGLIK